MISLFIRSMLLYGVMILTLRVLGKRQLGELQPYEFALTILLADIVSGPIGSVSTPLLYGLLPVAAVMVVHGLLTIACMKSDRLRAVVSGKPTLVISRGVVNRAELERLCLSLSDLLEGLRGAGFMDPAEVGTAVVEANGKISAFADAQNRCPKTSEMNIAAPFEGLPLPLVMDGRVQAHNLKQARRDEAWLNVLLERRGLRSTGVYFACLNTRGELNLQLPDGTKMCFPVMEEGEVKW